MKLPPIVHVTWNDAWASIAGYNPTDIKKDHTPHVTHSVGFLVRSDRAGVMLAASYDFEEGDDEPSYDLVLFVPRGMVKTVKRL